MSNSFFDVFIIFWLRMLQMLHFILRLFVGFRAETELTTAVLLIVEIVLTEQFVTALLQPPLAPVAGIECDATLSGRPLSCHVDLVEGFPTAGGEGCGESGEALSGCYLCGAEQTDAKTL